MDLMQVAVRFTTVGEDNVRKSLQNVQAETLKTGEQIPQAIGSAKNEFGNLAKAVNNVGNEFGLGLNRGIAMAGQHLAEAARQAQDYITKARAAAGATTLLATAQRAAAAAGQALSGVFAAFGGPIGVALIGGILTLNHLLEKFEGDAKKAEDAYDKVKEATQKVYEQQVAAEVGWLNTSRAIGEATEQLKAYRKGGEDALNREKDWETAFKAARTQWEAIPGNLKQVSDAALITDASFVKMFESQMKVVLAQRELAKAQKGADVVKQAKEGQAEVNAALFEQHKLNIKMMQDQLKATMEAKDKEHAVLSDAETKRINLEQDQRQKIEKIFSDFDAESERLNNEAFKRKVDAIVQQSLELANVLASSLEAGLSAAFTGKNPLAALGGAILAGFGQILIQIGTTALAASPFITAISVALQTLSGGALAAAGLGLIGVGALLKAAGGALTGGAGGGGGAYYGGGGQQYNGNYQTVSFGAPSTAVAAGNTPMPPVHFTVIGPNDPSAQRMISELVIKASRRGLGFAMAGA